MFIENENNFKKILSYSYSDDDIRHYLPDAKIIEYKDLSRYNNIFELLPEDKSYVFILVETKKRSGHWTFLSRLGSGATDGKLLYFDSYAKSVDDELKFINPWWRKQLQEDEKLLTKLIKNSPYKLEYMARRLQSNYKWDCSCGRWCVLFGLKFLSGMDIGQFLDWLDFLVENNNLEKYKELKYDIIVVEQISYTPSS